MPSSPLAMLMRQIETDLRSPMPMQAPMAMQEAVPPTRFDAEQYFAEGGAVHMAGGGPVDEPRPLTIRRGVTPQSLAAEMVPPEEQGMIDGQRAASPSPEGFTEGLTAAAEGIAPLGRIVGEYASSRAQDPTQIPGDIATFGKTMYHAATEDPIGFVGGMLPGIGNVMAAGDVSKLKDAAAQAEAEGNTELADKLKALVTTAMAGVAMPMAGGAVAKGAVRAGERAVIEGAEKAAIRIGERELPILRSTDDLFEVMDANAHVGRAKPDAVLPIDAVEGGVDLADPKQRARVDALKEKMMGDDGHISRIIVDQDGNVVEGQHRLEALRELGATEVPVSQFEDLAANVNMGKLGESLDKAQRMGSDQRSSLISHAFDALKEEGSVAKIRENYDAPKGYEKGWNAVLDDLEGQMGKGVEQAVDGAERAKNFANWFGESKMVDENNKPLVLYHGSKDDIGYFNLHHPNRKDAGWLGTGVYLTDDPDLASIYAKHQKSGPQGPNVMPLHAKLENPFYAPSEFKDKIRNIENSQGKEAAKEAADALTRDLQAKGHDGVVFDYGNNKGREIVVFEPTGVKSSTGNKGTFSSKSDMVNEAKGGPIHAFADGGPVDLPEQVANVAHDIARIAHKDRLDQRHLAYLLKAASGMNLPPERAMEFAGQIMVGDAAGLMQRFQTYVPSARTFARLNEMMGGKHDFMGKGHMGKEMQRMKGVDALQRTKDALDAAMDSDVVRDRPAMAKALKRLSKGI